MLGSSLAQAEEVCYDGDGTTTGIKGLEMFSDQFGQITIDVDFKYTTGFDLYGSDLDGFPFTQFAEDDTYLAMVAINQALTAENPVPDFAGLSGQITFYIGFEEETGLNQGAIAVVGGANYTGEQWAPCEREGVDDCLLGAGIVNASKQFTYADLAHTDNGTCDAGPPPGPEFDIIPGISGSWNDPVRNYEGYAFEVIGTPGDYWVNTYFYTYDEVGNQMWVTGVGPVDGDTVVVPMVVTSGAVFGEDFDTNDVIIEEWGTMTFTFSSCIEGSGSYTSIMGDRLIEFQRLTYIAGLACP